MAPRPTRAPREWGIAKLLHLSNQKVSLVKIDPYLNYDAGTMNPIAHGEVFVTEDGGECDMDIGNYERFLNQNIPKSHNITTAQIYSRVISLKRKMSLQEELPQKTMPESPFVEKRLSWNFLLCVGSCLDRYPNDRTIGESS